MSGSAHCKNWLQSRSPIGQRITLGPRALKTKVEMTRDSVHDGCPTTTAPRRVA